MHSYHFLKALVSLSAIFSTCIHNNPVILYHSSAKLHLYSHLCSWNTVTDKTSLWPHFRLNCVSQ